MTTVSRPRIGVSACFDHADPERRFFKGKPLLYVEESLAHWIMAEGALPFMLPTAAGKVTARDLVAAIDGLVLTGGADMSPRNYGEDPLRPEWAGDPVRDAYEMELVRLCLQMDKPILGVCRGAQVINVTLGGSLYQDIQTLHEGHLVHRNWDIYDKHAHDVAFEPGSLLAAWYGSGGGRINSVHHQGIKKLGKDLIVEARSVPDGVIEAVRYIPGPGMQPGFTPFVYGVQWHPEFILTMNRPDWLDPLVPLRAFLKEVTART